MDMNITRANIEAIKDDILGDFHFYGPCCVSFISGICLMTMGFSILRNKRLNVYPYTLIAWISLFESSLFFLYSGMILIFNERIFLIV